MGGRERKRLREKLEGGELKTPTAELPLVTRVVREHADRGVVVDTELAVDVLEDPGLPRGILHVPMQRPQPTEARGCDNVHLGELGGRHATHKRSEERRVA